ncbi:MAG: hypothetical protein RPU64_09540 [Candidatus Sedimenticola sp. (ex Thyasira tokunagai)]
MQTRAAILLAATVLSGCNENNPQEQLDIQIVIFDDSSCLNPSYTVELEEKSVMVTRNQVGREKTGLLAKVETQINLSPIPAKDNSVSYVLKASYSNCEELVSKERKVESGWYIYEFIRDNKIEHKVRAKW